jgi:hypothetical protein
MSYRIEYQWAVFRVPEAVDLAAPRLIVAIEGGDNNVREARTGKRARRWDVCMIGTASQVLKQAVYFAGACEGGLLKPAGRDASPEAYIRRIRRLVEQESRPNSGAWSPDIRVPENHPAAPFAQQLGLSTDSEVRYDQKRVRVLLTHEQRNRVFDFLDRFPDLMGWQLASVCGLPSS